MCKVPLIKCIKKELKNGKKEVLGIYIGVTESAKYWLSVLNEIKTRGVKEILIFCSDNLRGIQEGLKAAYANSDHQLCIVHQIRNSIKHLSYKDVKKVCEDLKKIYNASTAEIGYEELEEFRKKWDSKYKYIGESWERNWIELSAFWKYPPEIRRLIYTTNPIEAYNRA